jgi:hypothetical protein
MHECLRAHIYKINANLELAYNALEQFKINYMKEEL